ncbi:hypothetical protein SAMN05443575_1759 [Jatrophihabitans endophyticus]|uniref:Uncharacterized protein n=1 Tax=Jatrophihabitans endophyticus TaxID=1206085 RepID=A0A1M5I562_9ACTN|nr:DUF6039 family protein [Jatrophihabitans endophyticus]SHG23412.1 hypothetical protein SAMN05443575_1759 [Jatrophihabitans endophyticus]
MAAATDTAPQTTIPCAHMQTSLTPDKLINSANAGLIIHRVGQFKYEFSDEGHGFSVDLLNYINENQLGTATTFCYEETFGVRDRVHWLIHMRSADAYKKLLHMVDHDEKFQDISIRDRLPEKGHGNWEKIFIESSMQERILVPQHGVNQHHDDDDDPDLFAPPAYNQTMQPRDEQLHSGNAGAIVMRAGNVKYEFREEGRIFWWDWQEHVNLALPGRVTSFLYEETWGRQDRVHCLIHLRDLEDYKAVLELERDPAFREEVYAKQRVHESKGGGTWEQLFVDGTIDDTLLVPRMPSQH